MNQREMGNYYETLACDYLMGRGIVILERNFRCVLGEIDIIGVEDGFTVFFEVKARRKKTAGSAAEAVTIKKQRKICRVADYYRTLHGISDFSPIRYDCVVIDNGQITWYRAAFSHIY